jgi:hypothetical protein
MHTAMQILRLQSVRSRERATRDVIGAEMRQPQAHGPSGRFRACWSAPRLADDVQTMADFSLCAISCEYAGPQFACLTRTMSAKVAMTAADYGATATAATNTGATSTWHPPTADEVPKTRAWSISTVPDVPEKRVAAEKNLWWWNLGCGLLHLFQAVVVLGLGAFASFFISPQSVFTLSPCCS